MIALNVLLVLFGGIWTTLLGVPVLIVICTTYPVAIVLGAAGARELADRIVEWNATLMGWVAQRLWAKAILAACGIKVSTVAHAEIDWRQTHVICANHASIFDILALALVVPPPFRFVAKRELLRWPIIGWALKPSGQIVIDRKNHDSSLRKLETEANRQVRGQVIFFVEGTRSRDGHLLSFKKGAFHFAVDRNLPVLPTAICGSFGVLGRTAWWRLHPGRDIEIRFCQPIAVPRSEDVKESVTALLESTRTAISEAMEKPVGPGPA